MPLGVYERSAEEKERLSLVFGRKGHHDSALLEAVRHIITNSNQILTIAEIHRLLSNDGMLTDDKKGYYHLCSQLSSAFKNGRLNKNKIRNGRSDGLTYRLPPRFYVGDKVRIIRTNNRTPDWVRQQLRLNNCRTIVTAIPTKYHTRYYLGFNRIGSNCAELHAFRATELEPFIKSTVGRPRSKRKYTRKAVNTACGLNKDTSPLVSVSLMDSSVSPSISCVNCKVEVLV